MSKGIIVLAQNSEKTNYVDQACALALSIKHTNPNIPVSIITDDIIEEYAVELFDKIIPIPWGDLANKSNWKVENRWKIYHCSPYDETIVLDTDIVSPTSLLNEPVEVIEPLIFLSNSTEPVTFNEPVIPNEPDKNSFNCFLFKSAIMNQTFLEI